MIITHMTSWSDWHLPLNEYPRRLKGKALHKWILKNLEGRNRISIFEVVEDQRMARTFDYLCSIGRIKTDNNMLYPHIGIRLR